MKLRYVFAGLVSRLLKNVLRYRTGLVWMNLARSFPELKYNELRKVFDDFYRNLGDIVAETFWFGLAGRKEVLRSGLIRVENPDLLNDVYLNNGNGAIILNSHCGNWEVMGTLASVNREGGVFCFGEEKYCVVYKKLSSSFWNSFFKRNRLCNMADPKHYEGYVENSQVVRHIISHKGEGMLYDFKTDQHPFKGSARMEIGEFLHQKSDTMYGGVSLAGKYGMAVVYLNLDRESRGHYAARFTRICDNASEMSTEDIMRTYYDLLQRDIENNPSNYLWTHNRWK